MSIINLSLPKIDEESLDNKKNVKRIMNYLALLDEQLRYALQNISFEDNMDETTTKWKYETDDKSSQLSFDINGLAVRVEDNEKGIATLVVKADEIAARVEDTEGNVSNLQQTATEIEADLRNTEGDVSQLKLTASQLSTTLADAEKNISTLQQTAESIQTAVKDAEDNISTLQQTSTSIQTALKTAQGDISVLQQTASSLQTLISNAQGDISSLQQTAESIQTTVQNNTNQISVVRQEADKINWLVASGTSASSFTLTDRLIDLISEEIDITGYVTFRDLERSGSTEINGDNITTGQIDCELISSDGDYVFYRSSSGLQIGYGLPSGDGILLGGDRVLVCQRSAELAFFGSSGNTRQAVARASTYDEAADLATKINILIDALESYGLIESV